MHCATCLRGHGLAALLLICLGFGASAAPAPAGDSVVGARYPTLSPDGKSIAFCYWGDIWVAPLDGGSPARRLTDHLAWDYNPQFSPDGSMLAFNSTRSGNTDIWVLPSGGGTARQVTTHSGSEVLSGWLADGSGAVFHANRGQWSTDIWTVPVPASGPADSGVETQLTAADHDALTWARALPGGGFVLNRGGGGRWWRKRYRGSGQNDIWRLDPPTRGERWGRLTQLTNFEGKDDWPLVSGDGSTVYYVCDEDGFDNIWALSLSDGGRRQVTQHKSDGVQWPGIQPGGDLLVYELDGEVWSVDGKGGAQPRKLSLRISAEGKDNWTRRVSFSDSIGEYTVSPDGRYAVIEYMGDLWAIRDPDTYRKDSAPDQDLSRAVRLTPTDNARERNPAFAPDNRHIVYSSDAGGNYDLYVMDLSDLSSRRLTKGPGDFLNAEYDPSDGDYVYCFANNTEIRRVSVKDGSSRVVASGRFRGAFGYMSFAISPDGKWLAYIGEDNDWSSEIMLVATSGEGKPVNITRHPASDSNPQWSRDGSRLLWRSNRENEEWAYYAVELNPQTFPLTTDFFLPEEAKDSAPAKKPAGPAEGKADSPEAEKPDAEAGSEAPKDGDAESGKDEADNGKDKKDSKKKVEVKINFDDIHMRARRITRQANTGSGILSADGKWLIYQADPDSTSAKIWAIRADPRPQGAKPDGYEASRLQDGGWSSPQLTADGKRIYYLEGSGGGGGRFGSGGNSGGALRYAKYADGKFSGKESIPLRGEYTLDRRARWQQMFREGWHVLGQRFYDPKLHGVDWPATYRKYSRFIDHIGTPEEFDLLFHEMLGELNASHLGLGMSESSYSGGGVSTGHLGLEFNDGTMSLPFPGSQPGDHGGDGLLVTHVVYNGPAHQPGLDISVGDRVLSIDGVAVSTGMRWYDLLQDKAGLPVKLRVRKADGSEKDLLIKCASWGQYQGLLYREWERANEEMVARLSDGRIGYLHISGMNQSELRRFERRYFSEMLDKDAMIVDVRFNGGGNIHEQLFDLLDRNLFSWSAPREAAWRIQPARSFLKPKALLINARSFSDAEIFPAGWRALGLGPVIGVATSGAVIGTSGFTLVDGSSVRLPYVGWYELDGRNLETSGTEPDVEVVLDPNTLHEGKDSQLETAVRLLLEELKNQPALPSVPKPYPPAR